MNKKSTKKTVKRVLDRDNPEWAREDFARAVSFTELPVRMQKILATPKRGPQKAPKKVPVSIRLSPDVVKAFRASGAGWQARVDEILRTHIK